VSTDAITPPATTLDANTAPTLADLFARTRHEGRAALVGYLPAGLPDVAGGRDVLRAMIEGTDGHGVDVVEVGLPYSDPLMDGPVIQDAVDRALRQGTRIADVLGTVEAVAATGTPALVMSYWNPVARYGPTAFARDLAAAGGRGVIVPDLIPEEAADWLAATSAAGLDPVFLVAPSSTDARIKSTAAATAGFLYAASTMGVTGTRSQVGGRAADLVRRCRAVTTLPVCVGLGVSTPEQAHEVAAYADGVIVGSAFVRAVLDAPDLAAACQATGHLAGALAAGVRRG
jgi:tryptophan synthase alpha chain